MAKGQVRSTKEDRKKKSTDKKDKTPRYLRGGSSPLGKASAEPKK